MSKLKKIDKDVTINYDPIEDMEFVEKKEENTKIVSVSESMQLQKQGWLVINIYRVDGIKKHVLIKK